MIHLSRLLETHAYSDSSAFILFVTGSSSDQCPSEIDREGLGERCARTTALPLLTAAPTSESWLLIVAMNNPKAASDLALSSLRALVSLDWIST